MKLLILSAWNADVLRWRDKGRLGFCLILEALRECFLEFRPSISVQKCVKYVSRNIFHSHA